MNRFSKRFPPLAVVLLATAIFFRVVESPLIAAESVPARYRYLFIVDGSQAMAPFAGDIARFVGTNILSGFDGWSGRGEPIGVWIYKDRVLRDAVPVEYWTQNQARRISLQTAGFIQQYPFGGPSRSGVAMNEALAIAHAADAMTILLINDGKQGISGTIFDERLNAAYAAALAHGGKVLVTRLAIRHGELSAWGVDALEAVGGGIESVAAGQSSAANPQQISEPPVEQPKPTPLVETKPLPPPPTLAKELTAPLSVAPLRYEDEDDKSKPPGSAGPRRPIVAARNNEPTQIVQPSALTTPPNATQATKPAAAVVEGKREPAKPEPTVQPIVEPVKQLAQATIAPSPQLPAATVSQSASQPTAQVPTKTSVPTPPPTQATQQSSITKQTAPAEVSDRYAPKIEVSQAFQNAPAGTEPTTAKSPIDVASSPAREIPSPLKTLPADNPGGKVPLAILDRASALIKTSAPPAQPVVKILDVQRKTNAIPPPPVLPERKEASIPRKAPTIAVRSNAAVALTIPEDGKSRSSLMIGFGLLGLAGLALVFVMRGSRKPTRPSIISRSIDGRR